MRWRKTCARPPGTTSARVRAAACPDREGRPDLHAGQVGHRLLRQWASPSTASARRPLQYIANLLMLRGHFGRPGAGICPVRGHSNVQGDRTVGIDEKPSAELLAQIEDVFGFHPPQQAWPGPWWTRCRPWSTAGPRCSSASAGISPPLCPTRRSCRRRCGRLKLTVTINTSSTAAIWCTARRR